jgi:uncharacterized protein YcbX
VDPETAERSLKEEPLKTLKTYRNNKKFPGGPCMGIYIGLRKRGVINVGDKVYIGN